MALIASAIAYAVAYRRSLGKTLEEPDITPASAATWMARLGGSSFEAAVARFSVRSLLRSRQHRMILSFFIGVPLGIAILFLNAPKEIGGPDAGGAFDALSVPLLASTMMIRGFWVLGTRAVFSLPLELPANWIFEMIALEPGPKCLRARRRALLMISLGPPLIFSGAILFSLWPWRAAAAHVAVLACAGCILAEFSVNGVQKIPFTCSYLPGRTKLHIMFLFWAYLIFGFLIEAAVWERKALQSIQGSLGVLVVLGVAAMISIIRNEWLARQPELELRFEEVPPDQVLTLELS
jgi:hypothetical protein